MAKFKIGQRVTVKMDHLKGLVGEIEHMGDSGMYIVHFNAKNEKRYWFGTHYGSEIFGTKGKPEDNEGYVAG